MATINLRNFSLGGVTGVTLTANVAGTARIALPDEDAPDIMIVNEGTVTVFVRTGDITVVADANAMAILPGEKGVYCRGLREIPITHIAAHVAVATQDVTVFQGSGA